VILEDLHWADEMSVRLLAFVARRLQAWRLLLLATAREEELVDAGMLQRTLGELGREPHVATVALGPLSRGDTVDLVQALSRPGSDPAVVACVAEQVWRTSEGNPFVAIEAMRAAAHEALTPRLEGLPVPERVREIIGRQLDQLDERSGELVARAAVIGREFEFGLLARLSGLTEEDAARGVEELTRRRVLHTVAGRLDFTHDRVREVAYGRILAPSRKVLHRRVAEALATLHAKDLEPHQLALGLHYAEGEVWDQAVVHLRRAGVRAAERSAHREAAACFERARAALAHLPEDPFTLEQAFEICLELRPELQHLAEVRPALDRLREAEGLAKRLRDDRRLGRVYALMTNSHVQLGELDEGLGSGIRALTIAEVLGDLKLRIIATGYLLQVHQSRGEYERVVELATDNLAALPADWISEYFGLASPVAIYNYYSLIPSLAQLGRFAEAARNEAAMMRLISTDQMPRASSIANAHQAASTLHLLQGNWKRARSLIERWIAVARDADLVLQLPWAVVSSAWVLAQLNEKGAALSRLREGEQLLEEHAARGHVGFRAGASVSLGRASLLLGRFDEARSFGTCAIERSSSRFGVMAHALHLLGDVATRPDRFDSQSGETYYRQALALAEPRGMRPLVAHCHLGLGRLYRRTGNGQETRGHLTTATTMYREMDMPFWLERAEAEISPVQTSGRADRQRSAR
jgi:tetratricopeptide (TPR) repeat protein